LLQQRQVFRVHVKVAARGDLQPVADPRLQFVAQPPHLREIEPEPIVRMRRGYHVRNAIRDGRLCHLQRFFDLVGTVIQTRQNVTVQVNHSNSPSSPPCAERLPCAQRKQNSRKNLPHPLRLQLFRQPSSRDAPQEHSWDQQQSRFPGDKVLSCICDQR